MFFTHLLTRPRRIRSSALNLVTNAIVTWNTVYMNAAIERLRAEGRIGRDIDLGHLSPALYGTSIPTVSTDPRSRVERQVSDP